MSLKNNGEQNLTNEQKVTEFLSKVDDWIEDRNADLAKENEEVEPIMALSSDEVRSLSQEKALSYSFVLFAHAEYLQGVYNKEKTVVDFCDDSIWFMVGDKLQNYGGQYSKWQEKYYSAVKENPMATELNRLKIMSQARLNRLSGKVDNTKKMATLLQDLGKRRGY